MAQQQFCLKWNNHTSNFLTQLMSFRSSDKLVDVTLSCEGHNIKAHRVVLSACSPYFETIFSENPCQHPIVIINGMKFAEIKAILDFMYKGEVNISHEGLSAFLKAAETLQVKGLAEVCGENKTVNDAIPQTETVPLLTHRADTPTRRRRRKRSLSDSNRSDDESVSRKMRDPSPEVHELSGDECFASDMKASENTSLNSLPQVPQNNAYTRLHQSSVSDMQADASEDEYEVEPSKLLEQTLTTDSVPLNNQVLSSSESSIKIKRVTGAPDNESSSLQGPDSPPDVKPIVQQFEDSATSSGALGPSDGAMMLYNDQSVSQPGPSNFQDSSILHDNPQSQGVSLTSKSVSSGTQLKSVNKILLPVTMPNVPQLFLINSSIWQQPKDVEAVNNHAYNTTQIKQEEPDMDTTSCSETPRFRLINSETPLPEFSEVIRSNLNENNISAVWGVFIDECAKYYYEKFPNIQNSSEYQAIGRKMFSKYPAIQCEGKEPWSFFCKSLSQKIRHIKWKIKRKRLGLTTCRSRKSRETINAIRMRSLKRKVDRRYTPSKQYKALLKELVEGWKNSSISEVRVIDILKMTHKGRRTWLASHPVSKISALIDEYPCFAVGKYVVQDFLFLVDKKDTSQMLQRLESLFSAVGDVMEPPLENANFQQSIEILRYMEDQISFYKGKSSFSKSIFVHKMNVPEDEMLQHVETIQNASPLLFVFSDGTNMQKAFIAADRTFIETDATALFEAIIVLIATYYTFSLEYPKSFSQILGIFQTYVVGEPYDGIKSNRCTMFLKSLSRKLILNN